MIWPHVVAVGQAKVIIESMLHGKEFLMMTQMPFAVAGRGIVLLFTNFGDGDFIFVDTVSGFGTQRAINAHANVVTPGHQAGTRCRTDGLSDVEVGEDAAFACHAVQVWRFVTFCTERTDIGISHVIHENDDKIWQLILSDTGTAHLDAGHGQETEKN